MREVLLALGLQSKNIRNRALFFVRNVLSAFEDGKLKTDLHENVISALAAADRQIAKVNAKRSVRARLKSAKVGEDVQPKLIASVRENPWTILNPTLLDNLVREEPDISPSHPYKAVPAALAQGVIQQVCSDMKGFQRAVNEHRKNPNKFTGRPAMPGYLGSDDVASFEIPLSRTTGKNLPPITKKTVACDVKCLEYLTDEQKATWDSYALGESVQKMLDRLQPNARAKSFRVTFSKGRPSFVVVFDIDREIDDDSLMARVLKEANQKAGIRHTKFGATTQKRPTEDMLLASLKKTPETEKVAGLDFGMTNLLSLVFGNGAKGCILSASRVVRKLEHRQGKIDKWKSENTPPRLKELQARKESEKLSRAESREMRRLGREIYAHPDYAKKTGSLARWSDDAFKKVAAGVIKQLKANGIEALVVGLNKG